MSTTPRRLRVAAIISAIGLLAASCGGGDDTVADGPDATSPGVTTVDERNGTALAEAIRIDAAVDARIGTAADYTGVSDPTPVNAGDNIRTDGTGFAEIAYFDNSVTRLDINTDFTVTELVDNPGNSVIRTQMGAGRTWHRVQTLTGNDTYEVETIVATAVVRGTAFVIECDATSCTFTVLEGTVELILPDGTTITLTTGQTLMIIADTAPGAPVTINGNPFDDEWLTRNNALDQDAGNDDLADDTGAPPTGFDPDGEAVEFDLVLTLTSWENGGDSRFGPELGHVTGSDDPDDSFSTKLQLICFDERCAANAWVGGAGWGQAMFAAEPSPDGGLRFQQSTSNYCGGDEVGLDEVELTLSVDYAGGTVTGELNRTDTPLESGDCRYSAETRSVSGSVVARGTCEEVVDYEDCISFLVGEDRPSNFDRPAGWR